MKKYTMFSFLTAGLLCLGAAGAASAQTTTPATPPSSTPSASSTMEPATASASTGKDLAASAALSPDHSTLLKALSAAGLADKAKEAGPYTVFAPDNAAFDKLPAGTLTTLLQPANKKKLAGLLSYHVVQGSVMAADLKDGQTVKTVQGESLKVNVRGGTVTLTDAKGGTATVTKADIKTTNGVVHSVDTVLMPTK